MKFVSFTNVAQSNVALQCDHYKESNQNDVFDRCKNVRERSLYEPSFKDRSVHHKARYYYSNRKIHTSWKGQLGLRRKSTRFHSKDSEPKAQVSLLTYTASTKRMTSPTSKKRKYEDENRGFNLEWEEDYAFTSKENKPLCPNLP